jgi:subtilisin family serine protease
MYILLLVLALLLPGAAAGANQNPGADSSKSSRYGPYRTPPGPGSPKKAVSPFEEHLKKAAPRPLKPGDFIPGRVLIKTTPTFRAHSPQKQKEKLAPHGVLRHEKVFPKAKPPMPGAQVISPKGKRVPMPDLTLWHRVVIPHDADHEAVIRDLKKNPDVQLAELDFTRRLLGGPAAGEEFFPAPAILQSGPFSDPHYTQQWHLNAARVQDAWDYLAGQGLPAGGNRDVVVAVIDTGVDFNHPDLAANMWVNSREIPGNGIDDDGNGYVDDVHGIDCITNSGNPLDDHGHGTHVAGIIAAQADNGAGGVGVAYNVQLMAIKAAQYSGVLAASDIAQGVFYAVAQGADVINMSFGGYTRSSVEEDALTVAFGQAVLVAAAGNDGKVNLPCPRGQDMYPAAYNWVLGVMASDEAGAMTSWSNKDCVPHDTHEYELLAPGVAILSTLPMEQYAAWSGTSMSAAVVSGVAALVRTKFSDKEVYSSRFIMGQIASTAASVVNAYAALADTPKPELSYLEHWLFDKPDLNPVNDDDGIVDAGETINLAIVIRNHWGKADSVSVTLEPLAEGATLPDPYVTMLNATVDYGAVGSFNWDDNGLIYDEQGLIIGVNPETAFRFQVSADTPNNHVIPFKITMTAMNGLDPEDITTYTFTSRFELVVQKGRELPRIISQDMTLTKDDLWIVPGATLIGSGVTLTITPGTQMQFGTPKPADPYSEQTRPMLQVAGNLQINGTYNEPIDLFPYLGGTYQNTYIETVAKYIGNFTSNYLKNWLPNNLTYCNIW